MEDRKIKETETVTGTIPSRRKWILFLIMAIVVLVAATTLIVVVLMDDTSKKENERLSSPQKNQGPTSMPNLMPVIPPTAASTVGNPSSSPPTTPQATSGTDVTETITRQGSYELMETYPHDPLAFTQGLEVVPGNSQEYFESTGLFGASSLRRVDLMTGQILQFRSLDIQYFGEGLTYCYHAPSEQEEENYHPRLIQLTWLNGLAFIYDAETFDLLEERNVASSTTNGEGWGICHVSDKDDDGNEDGIFYVTDGTEFLHKWDMTTLTLMEKVSVTIRQEEMDGGISSSPISRLNELEYDYHSNTILSNIWTFDQIIRIHPPTGFITQIYNLTSIVDLHRTSGVLNGIAITETPNEILITGKNWPNLYRIRLLDGMK